MQQERKLGSPLRLFNFTYNNNGLRVTLEHLHHVPFIPIDSSRSVSQRSNILIYNNKHEQCGYFSGTWSIDINNRTQFIVSQSLNLKDSFHEPEYRGMMRAVVKEAFNHGIVDVWMSDTEENLSNEAKHMYEVLIDNAHKNQDEPYMYDEYTSRKQHRYVFRKK